MKEPVLFHQQVEPDYYVVQKLIPFDYDVPHEGGTWHSIHGTATQDLDWAKDVLALRRRNEPGFQFRIAAVATLIHPY